MTYILLFLNDAQKTAYFSAIFVNVIKFITKNIAPIQLCEVSLLLALMLLKPYAFFACPNLASI